MICNIAKISDLKTKPVTLAAKAELKVVILETFDSSYFHGKLFL